ncbi:Cytochrome c oxidase subunit 3 [Nocardia cerradoensis]|uniref:Cytochrome aa3 subunit 3 n=1 Tax=Nocardia cerradoensis TaxID=85688 RepID=A0A231H477_9NOCA|nr:cytochrome c oxidase subunit 3 family protein [Nocardia cerradoensis]OXR43661.1 Cytochrome c oxidase subunit 3 [Nocardia cerradoensis]
MTIDRRSATGDTEQLSTATTLRERPISPAKRVPGENGVWIFIYGDLTVFGLLFCMYMLYRSHQTTVFADSQKSLFQDIGFANTIILLISSLFVVIGMRALAGGGNRRARGAFVGAMACGVAFVAFKIVEWSAEADAGRTPYTNDFYQLYYILTGLHLVHVLVGLGVLVYLFKTAQVSVVGPSRLATAESGACFWHMVDLLWVVIFPLIYLLT